MTERLTTLSAVKEWLEIDADIPAATDGQLTRLIDAASQYVIGLLNRDSLQAREYTQNFKGNGKDTQLLRNWPVLDVSSVGITGTLIAASSLGQGGMPSSGYTISDSRDAPQSIDLHGYTFWFRTPCQVIYEAGYRATEDYTIADNAEGDYVVFTPTSGCWSADIGVTIDGVDAVKVTSDPTVGQYAVSEWGVYTFNDGDADKVAAVTFSFTPWALSQATLELIGEWWKRKDRIGILSKSLGGQETISFSQKDMNDSIRSSIQLYRNVVPV